LILTSERDDLNALPTPRPAILRGYRWRVVHGKDCPALLPGEEDDYVDGLLSLPRNMDDRRKLNNFEAEQDLPTM